MNVKIVTAGLAKILEISASSTGDIASVDTILVLRAWAYFLRATGKGFSENHGTKHGTKNGSGN